MKILIDSNILINVLDTSSSKHTACRSYIAHNRDDIVIAQQNIMESLRVVTHRAYKLNVNSEDVVGAVSKLTSQLSVITPTQNTLSLVHELILRHNIRGNRVFDTHLAATAISNDIFAIATDNTKDFEMFDALQVIDPFEVA